MMSVIIYFGLGVVWGLCVSIMALLVIFRLEPVIRNTVVSLQKGPKGYIIDEEEEDRGRRQKMNEADQINSDVPVEELL